MYLDFYGFSETPFSLSPNPHFIYYSSIHKEAFALLLYGIDRHYGFVLLTGEVGTGKTTILRTLLSQLDEEKYRTALIFNPIMSAVDLMAAINHEYGLSCESGNCTELLGDLNRFLIAENAAGRTVVLIIDEAQNLTPELLEQVRLISNLETDTEKLIQIVLAGQPELAAMLEKPELRQINQRIALRYSLHPLDRIDTQGYIEHRLKMAGGSGRVLFTGWALRWLFHYSRGTPRLINILCDRALLVAYTMDRRKITSRTVALAFKDVMLKPALGFLSPIGKKGALAIIAALMAGWGYLYLSRTGDSGPPAHEAVRMEEPGPVSPSTADDGKETSLVATLEKKGEAPPAKPAPSKDISARSPLPAPPRVPVAGGGSRPLPPVPPQVAKGQSSAIPSKAGGITSQSGRQTALQAFNALASLLRVAPVNRLENRLPLIDQLKGEASRRGLELDLFSGGLDELIRLHVPAIIDIPQGNGKEGYLVALTGARGDTLSIHPPLLGRSSFKKDEVAGLWSGHAYILWRNSDKIGLPLQQGDAGQDVIRLQILLKAAGADSLDVNGLFDSDTDREVREFQRSRKIRATGKVGTITLIQLYRAVTGAQKRDKGAGAVEEGS